MISLIPPTQIPRRHNERRGSGYGSDAYSYDFGNRKTAQEIAEGIAYDANELNQYSSITAGSVGVSPTFIPTCDADGNQTLLKKPLPAFGRSFTMPTSARSASPAKTKKPSSDAAMTTWDAAS